ncbi:Amidohydrolase [Aureliella helgolandensis]|uniref:Amidohydrolase n=1 Tax=Aureliella helgolandensis TaxID=2527968 RepID=A0A518G0C1_9BACT|nr:Amidohydrolase [Aureliella helgolandensis]
MSRTDYRAHAGERKLKISSCVRLVASLIGVVGVMVSGCQESAREENGQGPQYVSQGPPGEVATVQPIDEAGPTLRLSEFAPATKLRTESHLLTHASQPVVDVHSHLWFRTKRTPEELDEFVKLMDRNHISVVISLDARLGDRIDEHLKLLWTDYKDRFAAFTNINWQGEGQEDDPASWDCQREDFAHRMVLGLEDAAARGISGVKVFKAFGLKYRNPDGSLIAIDDVRFDPIWEACGRLGLPILIHTADPSAFFDPIDSKNERIEELSRHPDWHFPADRFPRREELHAARERLFARHRGTTFIAAHLGNDGEDLKETARMLEEHPNVVVEFASRISELGRQPYTARDFLVAYQDRVLFGTDGPWPEARYHLYWRFLETRDEYFPYSEYPVPPQGFWQIYGVDLPPPVLEKIYHGNAARIIPGIRERLEKNTSSGEFGER